MTIEVQGPDGAIIEFPDGTQPAVMQRAMQSKYGAPKPAAPSPQDAALAGARKELGTVPSRMEGMRRFNEAATFGGSKALMSGVFAGETGLAELAGKKPGYGMKDAYEAFQKAQTERTQKLRSPANTAWDVAGSVLGPVPFTKFLKGGSLAAKAAKAGVLGAALGGVSGAAHSDKIGDIPRSTATGALIGMPTGAISEIGLTILGKGLKWANQALGHRFAPASMTALSRLRETMEKDGLSKDRIDKAIKEWSASGVTPKLLDTAGPHTRSLLRDAVKKEGPAATKGQEFAEGVEINTPQDAIAQARKLVNQRRTATEMVGSLKAVRGRMAEKDYAGPYQAPIPITPQILSAIADKEGRSAVARALATARARRDYKQVEELQALLAAEAPKGLGDPRIPAAVRAKLQTEYMKKLPPVSAAAVDRIRIELGRMGEAAQGRPQTRAAAGGFYERAKDLDKALDGVTSLGPARARYKAMTQQMTAVELGQDFLNPKADAKDFSRIWNRLPVAARVTGRVGARQAITDMLAAKDPGVKQVLQHLARNRSAYDKIKTVFGEKEADRIRKSAGFRLKQLDAAGVVTPKSVHLEGEKVPHWYDFLHRNPITATIGGLFRASGGMSEQEREALIDYVTQNASDDIFSRGEALKKAGDIKRHLVARSGGVAGQYGAQQ